jgi:S1-C subfamily serine protease
MRFVASLFMAVALLAATAFSAEPSSTINPLVQKLQDVSVTIKANGAQGSGVLFTRKVGDCDVTYVWTAAHVVARNRKIRMVVINGTPKAVVEFEDAQIVQEFKQDGRRIGEIKMEARVVRYSDAQNGEDLALLQVRKNNFVGPETTINFYDGEIPTIGTELYHVGSLLGQFGSNSLTTGVVSQIGRVLDLGANGVIFDQTTVTAFPGSSGGGVFLKSDGRYVGMLVRGAGEQFNLTVPVRRLRDWAKSSKIEWAVDPSLPMPSAEELKKLPIEDSGVKFEPGYDAAKSPHDDGDEESAVNREFPFLLKRSVAARNEKSSAVTKPSMLQSIFAR